MRRSKAAPGKSPRGLRFSGTLVHRTPLDFSGARLDGPRAVPFEKGAFAGVGTIESPVLSADIAFDNLVVSWNAKLPPKTSLEVFIQVGDAKGWSRWYGMGRWDERGGASFGAQPDDWGRVDVDTLLLEKKADRLRYRVYLGATGDGLPTLRLLAVSYADSKSPRPRPGRPDAAVKELKLAGRSQMVEPQGHRMCSPTSLGMVLEFWGAQLATRRIIPAVYDHHAMIYGNWTLNAAFAGLQGLRAVVTRLNSMEELEREVAQGRPVPASITFKPGELDGAPLEKTGGHFVVVVGFTKKGDPIVRDPAAPSRATTRRVYKRAQFFNVWQVNKQGLSYLIAPPFPRDYWIGVARADLRRAPDGELLTQLEHGERVRAHEAKGDWVRVEAVDHLHKQGKRWTGYPGWLRAAALSSAAPKSAAALPRPALKPSRKNIVKVARRYLGATYLWGGNSKEGIDCSGLVRAAYRSAGINVPRDARDQFAVAKPVRRAALKPGDLIFLSEPGNARRIIHVMLYAGGDSIIESRLAGGKTITTTFKKRFGATLKRLESGKDVMDLSGTAPSRRRIYFASILADA